MTDVTLFVGLDVHKKTIAVALVDGTAGADVRFYGTIANTPDSLRTLCKRLSKNGQELHVCYEAGPCGYVVQRQLTRLGHRCDVVAPALIPRKAGDKVKTDRRDAMMLAQTLRAGQLTAVWIPDEAHEAMRDLVRLRAVTRAEKLRRWSTLRYGAKNWQRQPCRRPDRGDEARFRYVVTSLTGSAKHLYQTIYCGCGQAENFGRVHDAAIAADQDSRPRRRGRRSHPPLPPDGLPDAVIFRLLAGRFAAAGP